MNVLILLTDDRCTTPGGTAGTPSHTIAPTAVERLAAEGTVFDAAYTPSPIAGPARAAWEAGLPVRDLGCWDDHIVHHGAVAGWADELPAAGVRVHHIGGTARPGHRLNDASVPDQRLGIDADAGSERSRLADRACRRIIGQAAERRPFVLQVDLAATPPATADDDPIGRILHALDLAGLAEGTLVIATSLRTPPPGRRAATGRPLLSEAVTRVPLAVRGPGIPRGSVCHTPTTLLDGYRTILEAAGVPGQPCPDSRSWVDLASAPTDHERVVISEHHAFSATGASFMVRRGHFKLHHSAYATTGLFDVHADPEERHDLRGDAAHASTLAALEDALLERLDPEDVDWRARAAAVAVARRWGIDDIVIDLTEGFGSRIDQALHAP